MAAGIFEDNTVRMPFLDVAGDKKIAVEAAGNSAPELS